MNTLDIRNTYSLLMAVKQLLPPTTFLRDTFFPTNDTTDIFATQEVLVEYKDGNRKMAPFVAPRKGGVTMMRSGSFMESFEPPNIAPKTTFTIDELEKRGFGEALLTDLSIEQREAIMAMNDIEDLDSAISRREEYMAAQALINNSYIMKHIADDATKNDEKYIQFYEGSANPAVYVPQIGWNKQNADIIGDLYAMCEDLSSRGLPSGTFVCSPDVAAFVVNDDKIQKQLDNRNMNIGKIEPKKLPDGTALIATINAYGHMVDVISYAETYEDDDGKNKHYIPSGYGVMSAPGAGRTLYGAVKQMEQADHRYHTYMARRVPKYFADPKKDVRELYLKAKPLPIPNNKNAWLSCKVVEEDVD